MIKEITSLETFEVRHPVLRPGLPIESCRFNGDDDKATKHFGFYANDQLVGVASIFDATPPFETQFKSFQLRGMAVLSGFQNQNIGQKLLTHIEQIIEQKPVVVWFNARKVAEKFYQKMGYQPIGDYFDIPLIGAHIVMFKKC